MTTKNFQKTSTATYDQSVTTWTHGSPIKRLRGVDLLGGKVVATSDGWNGATVQAKLQGCIHDTDGSGTPDNSADWIDLETLSFTANATQYLGASSGYLSAVAAFQHLRIMGNISSGSPSDDVTFALTTHGDYTD